MPTSSSPLASEPGVIFRDYRAVERRRWPWPHFAPAEIACRCGCRELYLHRPTMDFLERLRAALGGPVRLNSAHRCARHNASIGGAPLSCHLKVAADVALGRRAPLVVLEAAERAGVRGVGYYGTFLHCDLGRARRWFGGAGARALWEPLLASRAEMRAAA